MVSFLRFSVIIDLSDLRGAVKNLTDHQSSNGSEFLNERETFILVRVESTLTIAFSKYCAGIKKLKINYNGDQIIQ